MVAMQLEHKLLGCKVSPVDSYNHAYRMVVQFSRDPEQCSYLTVNNAHTLVVAARDTEYRRIINESTLSLADGRPLSLLMKWSGMDEIARIFGATLLEKTIDWGQQDGLRHFFFGSRPETLDRMRAVIEQRFPRAVITGMVAPPFEQFSEQQNIDFFQQINAARADIVWVSLGAPKQERWVYENLHRLQGGILIPIGAGFDYLAGNLRHAPQWMKNFALEWLFRLWQEPHRLAKRYLIGNTLFIYYVLAEKLGWKKFD